MKKIRVKFCDGFFEDDFLFLPILRKHYEVELSDNPDYVIYSVFGKEHLKYDCIKIFTTGECVAPNFNECDYATGFDYITLGDRYLRMPLCCIMYRDGQNILPLAMQRGSDLAPVNAKRFCSFVVSNPNCMQERKQLFDLLNSYKVVDSGGRWLNNIGEPVQDKRLFEHQHKFCLTCENESYPGYTTEKLVDAFAAGSIPIYYGDPLVAEMFNPKAFVNCHDFPNFDAVLEYVRKLDRTPSLYREMLAQPICLRRLPDESDLEAFLCSIFDRELYAARRRPRSPRAYDVEHVPTWKDIVKARWNKVLHKFR